jgi:hypothetical protein
MKRSFLYHILFGYDFFISYSRADGAAYALGLANRLFQEGYTAYIDQWGSEPNKKVPESLLKVLNSSNILVLIGSPGAKESAAIGKELANFKATGRPIIPVSIGQKVKDAIWSEAILGLAHSIEKEENLASGVVSKDVLSRITKAFTYTRQRTRINRMIIALMLLIIVLPVIATYSSKKISQLQAQISVRTDSLTKLGKNLSVIREQRTAVVKALQQDSIKLKLKETELNNTNTQGNNVYKYAHDLNSYVNILTLYIYQIGESYHEPDLNTDFLNNGVPFRIFFGHDTSVPDEKAVSELTLLANYLKTPNLKDIKLEVIGFYSSLGVTPGDTTLQSKWGKLQYFLDANSGTIVHAVVMSKDLANSIKTFLVNAGLNAKQIRIRTSSINNPDIKTEFQFISHADIKIVK